MSVRIPIFTSFGYLSRSEIAGSYDNYCLAFLFFHTVKYNSVWSQRRNCLISNTVTFPFILFSVKMEITYIFVYKMYIINFRRTGDLDTCIFGVVPGLMGTSNKVSQFISVLPALR
jgi:hypothetical protein